MPQLLFYFFRCQTYFCYLCEARLPKEDPYSHFRIVSSPCYNQLFEGANDAFADEVVFEAVNFNDDSEDEDFFVVEDEEGLLRLV